jgi:hypothetical protein
VIGLKRGGIPASYGLEGRIEKRVLLSLEAPVMTKLIY